LTALVTADVLIIGAGPAGAAAACMLAPRHSVVLLDRSTPAFRIGESLIGAAHPLLRDLGVLEQFEAAGHEPSFGQASAWGSHEIDRRDSFLDPRGPGWHIERVRFETMLREAAAERGAIVIAHGAVWRVEREDGAGQGWTALVRSAGAMQRLHAHVVIDASGRVASFSRATAASQMIAHDRLVCRFAHLAPHDARGDLDSVSVVEAVADGWWYSAMLPDNSRVLAFHTDADLPAARRTREAGGFLSLLGETRWMAAWAPNHLDGPITRVSARSQWLANPCGNDWCAVGDAALAFDPLSSQGLFNALYTGLRGAQAVAAALAGNAMPLAAYRDRVAMIRDAYLRNLIRYYQMETRFRDRMFWRRRQSSFLD
jgi:flavin-dependent dehydrogenase